MFAKTKKMETKKNTMEVFQQEAPEVAAAFGGLIQAVSGMKALDSKVKQLIYIAMKASRGDVNAVRAHVPMAKKCGSYKRGGKRSYCTNNHRMWYSRSGKLPSYGFRSL